MPCRVRLDDRPDRDEQCDPHCCSPEGPSDFGPAVTTCSLDLAARADRLAQWHRLLADAVIEQSTDCAVAVLPEVAALPLTTLIVAELACCPFLHFEMAFEDSRVRLTLRGPEQVLVAITSPCAAAADQDDSRNGIARSR